MRTLLLAAIFAVVWPSAATSQTILDLLARMQSSDPLQRQYAFYDFIGIAAPQDLSAATTKADLIQLLETETEYMNTVADSDDPNHAEYVADVIGLVSSLRAPQSLPVLIPYLNTGHMVATTIAS